MKIFFTVGPTQIFPTINKHLNTAIRLEIFSLSHRGTQFKTMFKETTEGLRKLINIPKNYQIFFVSSALEAMERTIQGCVEKTSHHIITGYFGKTWAGYANQLGKNVTKTEAPIGEGIDISEIKIPSHAELICITQNDTSTGIWIDPKKIEKLKSKYPEKLIAVDLVSSVPYVDLNYKCISLAFFSVQKGFGLPSGLGVIIISPKALEKVMELVKKGIGIGSYHNLKALSERARDFQTPETPNILNIYLLNKVIKDMLKTGINKIREECDEKAKVLYDFFESHKKYQPVIKNPDFRSKTTLVFDVKGDTEKLKKKLSKTGFIIASGYGENKLNHIRIGNFPSHKLKDILQMLKYI